MNILHLHEWVEIKGGAEIYISQLQKLLPDHDCLTYWVGINEYTGVYKIAQYGTSVTYEYAHLKDVFLFLEDFIKTNSIEIINVHNIFNVDIVGFCLDRLPVVKFSHSPVMVCPGKQKFWRYSERPCTVPYGLHCLVHIYTEGCSDRHPKRIFRAWNYVNYELEKASKRYRRIIVMSDYIRAGLIELNVDERKILCNPYFTKWVDVALPLPGTAKHLLFVGRLSSSKGPHILLKAFYLLSQKNTDFYLDFVGDGPLRDELENEVSRLKLTDRVSFKGWLEHGEVEDILSKCHLLVFPSVYPEAFGITGIEAMMRGKPVVGFDVGGVSTWLKDNETGFLVEPGNIVEMAEKIKMSEDGQIYSRMSINAYRQARERFSSEPHIKKLVAVYSECLSETS